jgi:hypothetical protein
MPSIVMQILYDSGREAPITILVDTSNRVGSNFAIAVAHCMLSSVTSGTTQGIPSVDRMLTVSCCRWRYI